MSSACKSCVAFTRRLFVDRLCRVKLLSWSHSRRVHEVIQEDLVHRVDVLRNDLLALLLTEDALLLLLDEMAQLLLVALLALRLVHDMRGRRAVHAHHEALVRVHATADHLHVGVRVAVTIVASSTAASHRSSCGKFCDPP